MFYPVYNFTGSTFHPMFALSKQLPRHLPESSESAVKTQLSPYTIHHSRFGLTDHNSHLTTDHSPFHTIEAQTTFLMFVSGDEAALGWMYKWFYVPLIRYGRRIVWHEFEVSSWCRKHSCTSGNFGLGSAPCIMPGVFCAWCCAGNVMLGIASVKPCPRLYIPNSWKPWRWPRNLHRQHRLRRNFSSYQKQPCRDKKTACLLFFYFGSQMARPSP